MLYSTEKYNIVLVLFILIFFILFINYMFDTCQNKNDNENKKQANGNGNGNDKVDGFQNNNITNNNITNNNTINNNTTNNNITNNNTTKQYVKLKETLAHEKVRDEPYDEWNDKSLAQCLDECNNDEKCVGFVRDNISDKEKGNCYPKQDVKHCHTLKRGTQMERMDAINFNTYLKSSFLEKNLNLLNRCVGDETQTLNRDIFINSSVDPNLILTYDSIIKMKKHDLKDQNFHKTAKFKIVQGLENNTVSFILVDSFDDNYYLIDNYNTNDKLRHLELSIINEKESSFKSRSQASFYLEEGKSDKRKTSIANIFGNIKYYWYMNKNKISLVPEKFFDKKHKDHRKRMEHATFDILNLITETSVVEEFASRPNNRRKLKKYYNMNIGESFIDSFKSDLQNNSQDFKKTTSLIDYITIKDIDGNSIRFPTYLEIINTADLKKAANKYNLNLIKKLELKYSKFDTSIRTYDKIQDESIIREYNKMKFKLNLNETQDYNASQIDLKGENKFQNINGLLIAQLIIPNYKNYSVKVLNYDYTNKFISESDKKEISLFENNNLIIEAHNLIRNINKFSYSRSDVLNLIEKYNVNIDTNQDIKPLWNQMVFVLSSGLPNLTKLENDLLNDKISLNKNTNNKADNEVIEKILEKLNTSIVFTTRSIYIQKDNPKTRFDEITKNALTYQDDNDRKMDNLEQLFIRESGLNGKIKKFLHSQEGQLDFYKQLNNQKNTDIMRMNNDLINKINNTDIISNDYQNKKIMDNYFLINQISK